MDERTRWGYVIAGLLPIVVGAALVIVRGEVDGTNVALVMVLVVVLVAIVGGRGPAAVGAIIAALSFEFFFTRPYLSLRIDSADDVETTVILLVIGLVVGQVVTTARRQRSLVERGRDELARLRRIADLVAAGTETSALAHAVMDELTGLLSLPACRFERLLPLDLPILERTGSIHSAVRHLVGEELALPEPGVVLPVQGEGRGVGFIVMTGDPAVGVSREERLVAIALADQLGAAIARAGRDSS